MKNTCEKFVVLRLESTRSGDYAIYNNSGFDTWTHNYGYKSGDEVEVSVGEYDGYGATPYAPDLIKVNGNIIWDIKDRDNYLKNRERLFEERITENCIKNNLYHEKFNPNIGSIS